MKKYLLGLIFILSGFFLLFPGGQKLPRETELPSTHPRVLATTPWTAGFAYLAGAVEVDVLAPYDMRHPPEYEIRPGDLVRVSEAQILVFAGYERMMDKLMDAADQTSATRIQITTTHTRELLSTGALAIARELGTEDQARANLEALFSQLDLWKEELKSLGLSDQPVVAHVFQAQFLRELGVSVVGTFGPGPLEANQIVQLSRLEPVVVIDNWHNPAAGALAETLGGVAILEFINIPGQGNTRTLLDVFEYNKGLLDAVLR